MVVFLFDLLYLNGTSLIDKSFRERRKLLRESFNEVPGTVVFVTSLDTSETEEIGAFMEEAIRGNCEGIKKLNQPKIFLILRINDKNARRQI